MLEKLGKLLLKSPRVQMLEMLSKFFRIGARSEKRLE